MTPSRKQLSEVKRNFAKGECSGSQCSVCKKPARHGWWERVSVEYDEWECYCSQCAYDRIHQYDDFDADLYQRISEGKE